MTKNIHDDNNDEIILNIGYESLKGMAHNLQLIARGRKLTSAEEEDLVLINDAIDKFTKKQGNGGNPTHGKNN